MRNKKILIVMMAMLLSACGGRSLIPVRTQLQVVHPSPELVQCERITAFPDPHTLTDVQVATLINDLVRANNRCANNMDAIRQFIAAADQIVNQRH